MPDEKKEFKKVSLPPSLKREIALLAASESRYEYQIVEDAVKLYKQVADKPKVRNNKKNSPATNVIIA